VDGEKTVTEGFAECQYEKTLGKTLSKALAFAECQGKCTRQSQFPEFPETVTLPSVLALTLGKGCLCRVQHMAK
jgi:hypothetical protein